MKAGLELDLLVAQKIMGVFTAAPVDEEQPSTTEPSQGYRWAKPYSTDIAAAWEVVDRIDSRYGGEAAMRLRLMQRRDPEKQKVVWEAKWGGDFRGPIYYARADTPMLAICLAALRSVGIEFDEGE